MERPGPWLLAVLVGVAAGGGTYVWLVADPIFAGAIGLFWTLGAAFTVRHHARIGVPDEWRKSRWSGAFGGLAGLAALGVSPTLPLSTDLRFALALFVLGVALTTMHVGLALGLEYAGESEDETAARQAEPA